MNNGFFTGHFSPFYFTFSCEKSKIKGNCLLGQGCELQSFVSTAAPSSAQSLPPFCGAGLVHVRVLFCIPPPQVAEHSSQALQAVKLPFTGKRYHKRLIKRKSLCIVSLWTLYNCACIFDINFLEKAEKKYCTWRCCTICRHSIPWFVLRVGVTFPTEQKNYSHRTTYWFRAFFFFFFLWKKMAPKHVLQYVVKNWKSWSLNVLTRKLWS